MIYLNIKICALEFSEKILLISQLPLMHNHHLHASNRILRPARHNFPRTLTNNLLSLSFALSLVIYYGVPLDAALINIKAICADRSLTNQWINVENNRYFHNTSKFSTKNKKIRLRIEQIELVSVKRRTIPPMVDILKGLVNPMYFLGDFHADISGLCTFPTILSIEMTASAQKRSATANTIERQMKTLKELMPESYLRTGAGEPSGRSGMRGRPFLRSGKNKPMIISARIRFLLFRHAIVFFPRLVLQPLFAFYTRGQHVLRRDRRINERSCVFGGWCCFPFSLVNVQRPWWGVIVRARRKRRTLCYSAPTLEFHLNARLSTAAAEAAGVLHFETVTWRLLQLHAAYVRRMRNGGRRSKVINITGIFGHNHFSAPPPGAGNKSARAVWCTRKCLISNLPKTILFPS